MAARAPTRRTHLPSERAAMRALADQAFSRAAGAPLVAGNRVRVLRDAAENYPAWDAGDRSRAPRRFTSRCTSSTATRWAAGSSICSPRKAREGVTVRARLRLVRLRHWPAPRALPPAHRRRRRRSRVQSAAVRRTRSGWIRRNHRKLITVDGQVAFVSGLCLGQMWAGIPEKHREPWRDTGVEIRRARGRARRARRSPRAGASARRRRSADAGSSPSDGDIPPPDRSACGSFRPSRSRRRCSASTCSSPRWRAARSGSPTRTSSATARSSTRCSRRRATASTSGCCCRRAATSAGPCRCRARSTARCSNRASASSSGTAR